VGLTGLICAELREQSTAHAQRMKQSTCKMRADTSTDESSNKINGSFMSIDSIVLLHSFKTALLITCAYCLHSLAEPEMSRQTLLTSKI
jgi:hypothetical protein